MMQIKLYEYTVQTLFISNIEKIDTKGSRRTGYP